MTIDTDQDSPTVTRQKTPRTFLVVVDNTEEMHNALRFACRRALNTRGRVALLYVIEPIEFEHWLGVGRMMAEDARAEAEQEMQKLANDVFTLTGTMPAVYIREGRRTDELLRLLNEDSGISLLVLGTASQSSSPGPLVSAMMSHLGRRVRIPVTLVPGELSADEIDELT